MGNAVSRLCGCFRTYTALPHIRFSDCSYDITEASIDIENEDEETKKKCSPSELHHHKYDAKSLEAMLEDRMQKVETKIGKDIDTLKQLCNPNLGSDIEVLTSRLQELDNRKQDDAKSMETMLEDRLQKVEKDIESMIQQINPNLGSDIEILSGRLQELENRQQDDVKSMEDMLENRMQKVENEIESMKQLNIPCIGSDIAILTGRLQELENRKQDDVESMEAMLETRMQKIEKDIKTLQQMSFPNIGSDIADLTNGLQELENRKQDDANFMETMIEDRMQKVETKVENEIESMKQLCTPSLGSDIAILTGRLQELENRQQDDVKSMKAVLEDKMQNVETTMGKDIKTLQKLSNPNISSEVAVLTSRLQKLENRKQDDAKYMQTMLDDRLHKVETKVKELATSQQELEIKTSEDKKSITDTVQSLNVMVDDLHALNETKVKDLATSQQEFEIKTSEDIKSHADTVQSLKTMMEGLATSKQEFEIKTSEDIKIHADTVQSLKTMMEDLATSKREFEIKTSEDIKSHADTVQSLKTMMEGLSTSQQEFEIKTSEDRKSHADTVQSLNTMVKDLATSQQVFEIKTSEDSKSHADTVQSLKTMMEDLATSQQVFEIKTSEDSKSHADTVQSLNTMVEDLATSQQEFEIKTIEDIKSHADTVQSLNTIVEGLATSQQEFEIKTIEDIKSHADKLQSLSTMVQDLHTKVGRLNHSKYVNWVKTSLYLLYLKLGITKFSDEKADELHKAVLAKVKVEIRNAATTMCTQCTYVNIGKAKKNTSWQMNCNSNICNKWLKEILPHHSRPTKIAWANSNPQRWPSDVWELAKLFQPYGCEKHTKAGDSDCTELLTLMQDCKFIRKFLKNDTILQEIKEVRNACMHSDDLLINDADMRNGLNLMISLLEEKHLKKRQECIDAKRMIVQLRDSVLDLSLFKELESKALIQKMTEVRNDIDRLVIEQQHLKSAHDEMKNRQDNTEEDCNQMHERMKDFEQSVIEMKKRIAPLEKIADPSIDTNVTYLTTRLKELENRNKECMEDIGKSSPKSLTDEPWREVQYPFSPQYEKQLKEEMDKQFSSDRVETTNLLLLGPLYDETFSFASSVINICEGVDSYSSRRQFRVQFGWKGAPIACILKNVRLIVGGHDFRGAGCNPDDVSYMVNGQVNCDTTCCIRFIRKDSFPISVDNPSFIPEPNERKKIHCVIHVIDAEVLDLDTTRKENINQMRERLNDLGIPQVMVLTHIDDVCRMVKDDISNVYRSVKVKDMVDQASEMFKIPPDLIFPVQYYSFGDKIDYKRNIPILLALRRGMSLADDFLKKQEGLS